MNLMKRSPFLRLGLYLAATAALLSSFPFPVFAAESDPSSTVPASATLSDIGPNSRTWLVPSGATNRFGEAALSSTVHELGTGMHYWEPSAGTNGAWSPSVPAFDVTPEGDAFQALRVQHRTRIAYDLNTTEAVQVVLGDGTEISSTPSAIGLFSAKDGRSVIVASLVDNTNCFGTLTSSNVVTFKDAFNENGVRASVVFDIEKGSFAQDVIIHALDPSAFGFGPDDAVRIQIYTELYRFPEPDLIRHPVKVESDPAIRSQMVAPDIMDTTIGFSEFVLGVGRAYVQTATEAANNSFGAASVAKEIVVLDGRTFLRETIDYSDVAGALMAFNDSGTNSASRTASLWPKRHSKVPSAALAKAHVKSAARPVLAKLPSVPPCFFYAHSADLVASVSKVLQQQSLANNDVSSATTYSNNYAYYTNIAQLVRSNYLAQTNRTGVVTNSSGDILSLGWGNQSDYSMALFFDMVAEAQRPNCIQLLLSSPHRGITNYCDLYSGSSFSSSKSNILSCGIQAAARQMQTLSKEGRTDLAYLLLTNTVFPQWIYNVTNGTPGVFQPTTIPEHWNGYISGSDGGYLGGNSFNHYALGAVGEWVYNIVGGINSDEQASAFGNVIVKPKPGGGITNAFTTLDTIRGPVSVSWTNYAASSVFRLSVTNAANTTLSVFLPTTDLSSVTESGLPGTNAAGLLSFQITGGYVRLNLGSGAYSLSVTNPVFPQ